MIFFFLALDIIEEIGLLFQLADDILDVKGSKKLIGKPIKKDKKKIMIICFREIPHYKYDFLTDAITQYLA